MKNKSAILQEQAMRYGTIMGAFWIIKFVLLPMGFKVPLLQFLFILLTLFVPILGYKFACKYRDNYCNGEISYLNAFSFCFLMYIFTAMFTAAGHFIYFRFIDNGFLTGTYMSQLENVKSAVTGDLEVSIDQLIQSLDLIAALSPFQLTMQLFCQNIFYCSILAIPTALFVMKRKKQS